MLAGKARARMLGRSCAMLAMLPIVALAAAPADGFPQRPVRLIVPYPPGGAGDMIGRLLASRLAEAFAQQVIVDNRGGGGQVIATELTARAEPDGHTLLFASATHGINPALRAKLPYDSIRDFAAISLVADSPLVFVAHPSLAVGSIRELVAAARARPGAISYASSGPGTGGHLSVELLRWMTGTDMLHVPYKGAGPALTDLIGGQVQVMCTSPLPALPHVRSGRLRGLAVTSRARSRAAPEIPTVAEAVPGYESSLWYALLAPARTPQPVLDRIGAAAMRIVRQQEVAEQLLGQGADPVGAGAAETARFIAAEIERWTRVVRQANIRAQ